jgi:hypothetical protein
MHQDVQGPSRLPAIRVVSTPIPPRRLYGDLTLQLGALYDDLLSDPVPGALGALAARFDEATPSEEEMSDGAATIASGVDRRG